MKPKHRQGTNTDAEKDLRDPEQTNIGPNLGDPDKYGRSPVPDAQNPKN